MQEPDPDRFITSAEVDNERNFGPIITQPEDLQPDQLSLIPNPPQERTATELLDLQAELARQTDRDEAEIVQLAGCIREHGQAGLYQVTARPGSADVESYAVASYHDGHFDFGIDPSRDFAEAAYDRRGEELDVERRPT